MDYLSANAVLSKKSLKILTQESPHKAVSNILEEFFTVLHR